MSRDDWFRNKDWSDEIASAFARKLARARDKRQSLRIQASYLTQSRPRVALQLFDQYFAMGDHFDHAIAHVGRAEAFLALDQLDAALACYQDALLHEAAVPKYLTQAYLMLPLLIATRRVEDRYGQALNVLEAHKGRLMFPVDHFHWHAAKALIGEAVQDRNEAARHAGQAVAAAGIRHSGFGFHPGVGLTDSQHGELLERLKVLADLAG